MSGSKDGSGCGCFAVLVVIALLVLADWVQKTADENKILRERIEALEGKK